MWIESSREKKTEGTERRGAACCVNRIAEETACLSRGEEKFARARVGESARGWRDRLVGLDDPQISLEQTISRFIEL